LLFCFWLRCKVSLLKHSVTLLTSFSSGSIASIIRVQYVRVLAITDLDFWAEVQALCMWSAIEPGLGIIASSVATLRPLLQKGREYFKRNGWNWSSRYGSSRTTDSEQKITTNNGGSSYDPPNFFHDATVVQQGNDMNFLLSATRPMTNMQTIDQTFDEKEIEISQSNSANVTSPLTSILSGEVYEPSPIEERPQSYQQPPPEPYRSRSTEQKRATWWDYPSTSAVPDSQTESTAQVTMAPHGSRENSTNEPSHVSSPPPLEEGYRRWVIERNNLNTGDWHTHKRRR
jgi:rhodopsin domain-containing protein